MHLLIVDADPYERLGLRAAFQSRDHTVAEASDLAAALHLTETQTFDAVITDISLPADERVEGWARTTFGIDLARRVKMAQPQVGLVLYSAYEHYLDEFLELLGAGLRGLAYCLKGRRNDLLLATLTQVVAGRVEIDPEVHTRAHTIANELRLRLTPAERPWVERAVTILPKLTSQEAKAIQLLAASCSPEGVARRLSIQRADNLICRLYAKLGLDTVPQLSPELRQVSLAIKACQIHILEDHSV